MISNLDIHVTALESQEQINLELINAKKVNLENLRKQKLQSHFVRSCARWIEQREKATKFGVSKLFEQKTIKE